MFQELIYNNENCYWVSKAHEMWEFVKFQKSSYAFRGTQARPFKMPVVPAVRSR